MHLDTKISSNSFPSECHANNFRSLMNLFFYHVTEMHEKHCTEKSITFPFPHFQITFPTISFLWK